MNQTLWIAVAAFVIGGIVRAIKSDAVPVDVPKRFLPWLALGLGVVSAVLDQRVAGVDWETAVASGLVSTSIATFGHDALRAVPGVTKMLGVIPLFLVLLSVQGCTPDARRALLEKGFDVVTCALANMNLPNEEIVVKCAIQPEDKERILRIVGEQRQAQTEAVAQARAEAKAASCSGADAGAP